MLEVGNPFVKGVEVGGNAYYIFPLWEKSRTWTSSCYAKNPGQDTVITTSCSNCSLEQVPTEESGDGYPSKDTPQRTATREAVPTARNVIRSAPAFRLFHANA